MKILMVLTSHDQLGDTGHKTGFWLEEFAAPYFVFRDAGVKLTLASPKGGQPPVDPRSDLPENQTPAMTRFKQDAQAQKDLANTVKLSDMRSEGFDTIFFVGGHGPMWDIVDNPDSIALIEIILQLRKAGGRGLPFIGGVSSGDDQRRAPDQGKTRHRFHQWRGSVHEADQCRALPCRG